jgi:hypothetical protein
LNYTKISAFGLENTPFLATPNFQSQKFEKNIKKFFSFAINSLQEIKRLDRCDPGSFLGDGGAMFESLARTSREQQINETQPGALPAVCVLGERRWAN